MVASFLLSGVASPSASFAQVLDQVPTDSRAFTQTGFRVDRDSFFDYFSRRGGVSTFGYPVTRDFLFQGCTAQFFQRAILQQCGGTGVGMMNLLDDGLLPYTHMNGSTFPASDPTLTGAAPKVTDANYASAILDFVRAKAVDTFDGQQVNFRSTFFNTITAGVSGTDDPNILGLLDLEIWGAPTSQPAYDPANRNFIYQRFQRGIMHYDKTCGCTQGLLLADYLKALITGQNLPADLAAQAANSPLLRSAVNGIPPFGTTFGNAFAQSSTDATATMPDLAQLPLPAVQATTSPVAGATPTTVPTAVATTVPTAAATTVPTAVPTTLPTAVPTAAPTSVSPIAPAPQTGAVLPPPAPVSSPDYGLSMFLWGQTGTTDRDLKIGTSANFHWQKTLFQWRLIEGAGKGIYDWSEADRVVKASSASGIRIIARIDFQPDWARKDLAKNGPPDNYQDYADFIAAFANRYRPGSSVGTVDAIEVWNEVNINREWGNQPINQQQAADYVRLLTLAYRAAHAANPTITVVTAGLSPTGVHTSEAWDDAEYLQWLFDAGLKGGVNYDVLGAHGNTQAPCVECDLNSAPNFSHPSFYFRRVEQLRQVQVNAGDSNRQIWLLEFGWTSDTIHPNYAWFAVSEDQKAANVVKAFLYAKQHWAPWIGVMTLWTLSDPTWTPDREEYWWAISNADGSPRAALTAVKAARLNGSL